MTNQIDEKTKIPLSIIWVVGSAATGLIFWLTIMYANGNVTQDTVKEHSAQLRAIESRLPGMDEKLNFVYDWVREQKGRTR